MITNMSYDGVAPSTMMGTAAQTASLGDQDMMTYIPRNSQRRGDSGSALGSQEARGATGSPHSPSQQEQDDAALSADLMDIFGVGGMVTAVAGGIPPMRPQAMAAAASTGGGGVHSHHNTGRFAASPVGTSVSFQHMQPPPAPQHQHQHQHGGKQSQPQHLQQRPAAVSDSSCSGRSNASSGISSVTMPAHLSHVAAQRQQHTQATATATATARGPGGGLNPAAAPQVVSAPWMATADFAGMQSAWAALGQATAGAPNVNFNSGFGQVQPMAKPVMSLPPQFMQPGAAGSMATATTSQQPQQQQMPPPLMTGPKPKTTRMAGRKHGRGAGASSEAGGGGAVSENESERMKRRRERNEREQERSHRIAAQIAVLKDVLTEADVPFKPDKYSTLVSVADYIKSLQRRKSLLDTEHRKLLDTIKKTSDVIGAGHGPLSPSEVVSAGTSTPTTAETAAPMRPDEELMIFVRGLDYKTIFSNCGIALGIAAVDGRLVDCNDEFVALSGHAREDIVGGPDGTGKKMSLFNLLGRDWMEDVFKAMSEMLRNPIPAAAVPPGPPLPLPPPPKGDASTSPSTITSAAGAAAGGQIVRQHVGSGRGDHWSGVVTQSMRSDLKLRLNITLVRSQDGRPKFFNCALCPEEDQEDQTTCSR